MDRELYMALSNGFFATCDAFVLKDQNQHMHDLRLVSIIGSQAAVKAIAAGILKADTHPVILRPESEDSELEGFWSVREQVSGKWRSRIMRLPATKAWHGLVYSSMLEYNQEDPNFVLLAGLDSVEAMDRHLQFVNRRVTIPVHPEWKGWLWGRGLETGEILPLIAHGVSAWECKPQQDALKADISQGIRDGLLTV